MVVLKRTLNQLNAQLLKTLKYTESQKIQRPLSVIEFKFTLVCTYLKFINIYSPPFLWMALKQLSGEESILHTLSCTREHGFQDFPFQIFEYNMFQKYKETGNQ